MPLPKLKPLPAPPVIQTSTAVKPITKPVPEVLRIEPQINNLWTSYWAGSRQPIAMLLAMETVSRNDKDLFAAKVNRTTLIDFLKTAQSALGDHYTIQLLESKVFMHRFVGDDDSLPASGFFPRSDVGLYQGFIVWRDATGAATKPILQMDEDF